MAYFRNVLFFMIFVIIQATVQSSQITVKGPDQVFSGDYEMFTCQIIGDEVNDKYGYDWKFRFSSGATETLEESEMLAGLETKTISTGKLIVTSFLKASPGVTEIVCEHSPKVLGMKAVMVKDLKTVTRENDPCLEAEYHDTPVSTLSLLSNDPLNPSYRKSHFLDGQSLEVTNKGNEVRLECYSTTTSPPKWVVHQEMMSKMRYASWGENSKSSCKKQVFHIYQLDGQSGSIFNLSMDCVTETSRSPLMLKIHLSSTKGESFDSNSTGNCVNETGNSLNATELAGICLGSAAVIMLLLLGIAVLKRQLTQQKNCDQEKTSQRGCSTENLNPPQVP